MIDLSAFPLRDLQQAHGIVAMLLNAGVSPDNLQAQIHRAIVAEVAGFEREKEAMEIKMQQRRQAYLDKAPACPCCGTRMDLVRISEPKGPANLNGWKSAFVCPTDPCFYHEFSNLAVEGHLAKLGVEG